MLWKEYRDKASRFELTEAVERIDGVIDSVLAGIAKPCSANDELERIYEDIEADIELIQKPLSVEDIAARNPSFEDEE